MSRGGKIALIVGLAVVLLIVVGVILAVVLFVGVLSAPADVANNYVEALNEGDLSTAWGYLSKATQRDETRSGFDAKMEDFKGEIESYNTRGIEVSNGKAEITMDITLQSGEKGTWDMYLIKEGDDWKIQRVRY